MRELTKYLNESLFDEESFEYKLNKWFERDPEGLTQFNNYIQTVKSKHFIDKTALADFYYALKDGPKMVDFICDNTGFEDTQRDYLDTFYNIVKFSANV